MANFSFDTVSDYDKAEMNNVFDQTQREMDSRYDFKGTPANLEWLDDKRGSRLPVVVPGRSKPYLISYEKNLPPAVSARRYSIPRVKLQKAI